MSSSTVIATNFDRPLEGSVCGGSGENLDVTKNVKLSFWSHIKAMSEFLPKPLKLSIYEIHIKVMI